MNFRHKHLFLLPGLVVLIGILIFPILFTVRLSLSSWDSFYPGLDFIGLENYVRLFTEDARFWESFFRLGFLSLITVFLQYTLGFSLALLVWRDLAFKRFFRVLFLIPMMTTPVIMSVIWRTVFHESLGPANDLMNLIGIGPVAWLSTETMALVSVLIVEIWQWTPFVTIILFSVLISLNPDPIEAAKIDGASNFQIFWLKMPLAIF